MVQHCCSAPVPCDSTRLYKAEDSLSTQSTSDPDVVKGMSELREFMAWAGELGRPVSVGGGRLRGELQA